MYRVAIFGRPNVGKSTLFNRLTRSRKALVGNQPGMTRDRIEGEVRWDEAVFELVDTGGIVLDAEDEIPAKIFQHALVALDSCHLTLLLVDARSGLTVADEQLNDLLRQRGKDYWVVANKADTPQIAAQSSEFYAFGVPAVWPVSAEHGLGIEPLVEAIVRGCHQPTHGEPHEEIRIAIVGKPNVGKSSLLNRMVGEERAIVTETPGTTRDSVDTLLRFQNQRFRLIDTAGIRRKGKTAELAEKLSVIKSRESMRRAEVALLVVDAVEGLAKLDATIGGYAEEAGCSLIILINKWDLIAKDSFTAIEWEKDLRAQVRFLDYAPMLFVSAKTGLRVTKTLELAMEARNARSQRIATPVLNRFFEKRVAPVFRSSGTAKKFPLKFATQIGINPPSFLIFTRGRAPLHFSKVRFLINQLRQEYGFYATPIRMRQSKSRTSKRSK